MKYLIKKIKSAHYSCTAIRTKVKKTALWIHKKYKIKYHLKTKYIKHQFSIKRTNFFKNDCDEQYAYFQITCKSENCIDCSDCSDIMTKLEMQLNSSNLKPNEPNTQNLEDTELSENDIFTNIHSLSTKNGKEEKRKKDGEEYFDLITKMPKETIPIVNEKILLQLLKKYLQNHKHNQCAIAFFFMKDKRSILISPEFKVEYDNNNRHSEPPLCNKSEIILTKIGNCVDRIVIYTFNSPCSNCMSLLNKKNNSWHRKYGFSTTIVFTKYYPFLGRKFVKSKLNNYSLTELLDPNGVFYGFIKKYKKYPFKLDQFKKETKTETETEIDKYINNITGKGRINTCAEKMKRCVFKLNELASNSFCITHLQCGEKIISSFSFPPNIQKKFLTDWKKLVEKNAKSYIIKQIEQVFNVRLLEVVNKTSSCPLVRTTAL